MIRSLKMLAVVCALALLCGSVFADTVANPVYDAWKKAGKGASVTSLTKVDAMGNKTETESTLTCVEVTDEKVVLESKATTSMAGQKMEMPAQKIEIPAKVDGAAGTGTAPAKDANATTAEEKVTVPAGTFTCKVTTSNTEANGSKTTAKVYICDEVPGGVVKSETTTEGAMKMSTVTELQKIEKK